MQHCNVIILLLCYIAYAAFSGFARIQKKSRTRSVTFNRVPTLPDAAPRHHDIIASLLLFIIVWRVLATAAESIIKRRQPCYTQCHLKADAHASERRQEQALFTFTATKMARTHPS